MHNITYWSFVTFYYFICLFSWCKYSFYIWKFCVLFNLNTLITVFFFKVIDSLLASAQAFRLPPLNPWRRKKKPNYILNFSKYQYQSFNKWIIQLFNWKKVVNCWFVTLHFAYWYQKLWLHNFFFTHYRVLISYYHM